MKNLDNVNETEARIAIANMDMEKPKAKLMFLSGDGWGEIKEVKSLRPIKTEPSLQN